METMTDKEFEQFRDLVYHHCHIFCAESQKPLFERKISSRITELQLPSFRAYYHFLTIAPEGRQEFLKLVDKIAVHETSFFRLAGHFRGLHTRVFPEIFRRLASSPSPDSPIYIWSAGCSTGEEAYSIAMTFLGYVEGQPKQQRPSKSVQILATDLSDSVIKKAQAGKYNRARVMEIDKSLLDKYFMYQNHYYQVTLEVKNFVQFALFNLAHLEVPPAPRFDIIFCRNVLIYFNRVAQHTLLQRLIQLLPQGGYLFLGDAESIHTFPEVSRQLDLIEVEDALIYQKRGDYP